MITVFMFLDPPNHPCVVCKQPLGLDASYCGGRLGCCMYSTLTVYCTELGLLNVHRTLYTAHCTLYTVHSTMYNVRCKLNILNVHFTLFTVHCTLYTVHCTLQSSPSCVLIDSTTHHCPQPPEQNSPCYCTLFCSLIFSCSSSSPSPAPVPVHGS